MTYAKPFIPILRLPKLCWECAQQLLKGYSGPLNASALAPGEGLGLLTWMPRERCCSWDSSALERRSGAGGSSCCVLDCQHSNEGGFKSGTRSFG